MKDHSLKPLWSVPVIVAALGYFVDIYDLLLFSIVRRTSLQSIGVPEDQLLTQGEFVLQSQMVGLLLGGLIWGVMGDKKGRLSVLFGSILLYSLANIANGFVTTVNQYAILRFIGGIGLAGELGAGITLVSEVLPTRLRGYGTTLVATVGLMGAVLANFIAKKFDWQIAYFIGGGLGIEQTVQRGNFFQLFSNATRFKKFVGSVFIGLPIWFVIGILITFSPEFAKALHIDGTISAGDAVMYSYIGLAVGDLVSGFISQALRSRKKVVFLYVIVTTGMILIYLFTPGRSVFNFYLSCFLLGVSIGYWALFVTMAAEQFGTNLRSTVATSAPNFIRGMVVPLTLGFRFMREQLGGGESAVIYGALVVGIITIIIAFLSLQWVEETFSRDMNFVEEDR